MLWEHYNMFGDSCQQRKKSKKRLFRFLFFCLEKNFQKNEKNFKKGIDKEKVMWYNSQAVARRELRDSGTVIEN